MAKPVSLCGAETKEGGTCKSRVEAPGKRCSLHERQPLSSKEILKLCYETIGVVVTLAEAWDIFEKAYPTIVAILGPVSGSIMPEHFWYMGFKPKDRDGMSREMEAALQNSEQLEIKYSAYRVEDKLDVEAAY